MTAPLQPRGGDGTNSASDPAPASPTRTTASAPTALSRRDVLRGLLTGSGLVLGASVLGGPVLARSAIFAGLDVDAEPWQAHLFLALAATGDVSIVAHRSEMGTGIRTSLPMVMADELGADWSRVSLVQAPGDRRYGSQNTDGSRSIYEFFEPLRRVAATARTMLEGAAADQWGVPAGECEAVDHAVHHRGSGRSLPFAALVAAARERDVPAEGDVTLLPPERWRYIGKGVPLVDLEAIVTGAAGFGMDATLPDARVAVIARSPVLGGRAVSWNEDAALAVPGVQRVIRLADGPSPPAFFALGGVAVVADSTWAAIRGREALAVQWDPGFHADYDSDAFASASAAATQRPGVTAIERGDVHAALDAADRTLDVVYELPLLAHASMEPPCALARVDANHCEVWAPTQNPQAAVGMLAATLGLPPDAITVNVTLLGGGFGRKSKPDYIVEAALLSRELGEPVRLVWTREDDIRHDYYHACAAVRCQAALDAEGRSTGWLVRTAFPSISSTFQNGIDRGSVGELEMGLIDLPFALPNLRAETCEAAAHVRIGWLRSVCNIFHGFAVGSFVDELAHAAGRDPLEHLLALIGPPRRVDPADDGASYGNYDRSLDEYPIDTGRLAAVVRRAASEAGWGRKLPRGRGLGLAVHRSFLSMVATVVEVDVSKSGRVSIPRVDVAVDCGLAVNPDRVLAQFEGAAVFGASLALSGAITAKDGAVEQGNFDDYKVARMGDAPREVHVHLIQGDAPPAGVGEPGVPPFAPALCNALFAATGRRIRRLPLSRHDLSWS